MRVDFRLQYLWKEECFSSKNFMHVLDITLSLVSICARFLWTILTMPGGWIQASPSTCTGTPSSPRMVIFTWRHWDATEQKTAAVRPNFLFFFLPCIECFCSTAIPRLTSSVLCWGHRAVSCDPVKPAPLKLTSVKFYLRLFIYLIVIFCSDYIVILK